MRILSITPIVFLCLLICALLSAQNDCTQSAPIQTHHPIFDDFNVPRVDIDIAPVDLQLILANPESNTEYYATFTYDNGGEIATVENVGFRLRGNTSRNAAKKSFKISFNSFESGRKFHGLEKMNLNGEHNDPSIIRSKLCWDIFDAMDVIAARANHVELYINSDYMGLYINVEHIDEEFLKDRYPDNDGGNLYKCLWPADLNYEGISPEEYKKESSGRRKYDLKTNKEADDYSDFAHFINVLTQTEMPDFEVAISKVFDVDVFLRVLAADVFTSNWDGYSFNINNFYLYHNPRTGKFEYLPYDLDNSFGIDWFNINWGTRNVYDWTSDSHNNVLTDRILQVSDFKDRYTYYLQKLVNNYAHPNNFFPLIDCLHDQITPFAEADTYRTLDYGYSIEDFHNSYEQKLQGHVKYGIKDYITTRRNNILTQLELKNIAPIIRRVNHYPIVPRTDSPITFKATIEDDFDVSPEVVLHYQIGDGEWLDVTMLDNGSQNDVDESDGIYAYVLSTLNLSTDTPIRYYVTAMDGTNLQNREPLAGEYILGIGGRRPTLRINEFMVSNKETIVDEFGEYDDWIELYNSGEEPIFLGDKFLSDNLGNPNKWQLPDMTLAPKDFLLIWADNQTEQGTFHADFKLNKDSDAIGLFDTKESGFAVIDSFSYENLESDITYGLETDGEGSFTELATSSPNGTNITVDITQNNAYQNLIEVKAISPNPFDEKVVIMAFLKKDAKIGVTLFNTEGQKEELLPLQYFYSGNIEVECENLQKIVSGIYILQLRIEIENGMSVFVPLKRILKL
ncbi:MAG: CotH kinase family protein [Chitinophagales bacterium]